jgi:adenosylmethionine-8-amino-7-oxononanoate aminotransferase
MARTCLRARLRSLPVAVRGEGCYIYDADGRAYLDGSGGAAVSCLGHSDPDVRAAIHEQLDRIAFAHTGFFTSEPAEALADLLIEACARRDRPGLSAVRRVRGGRGRDQAGAAVFP